MSILSYLFNTTTKITRFKYQPRHQSIKYSNSTPSKLQNDFKSGGFGSATPNRDERMSLHIIPIELFFIISSNLDDIDKQCLRITCRAFRTLIPLGLPALIAPVWRNIKMDELGNDTVEFTHSSPYDLSPTKATRLEFLQRLVTPGNLYHGLPCHPCSGCVIFREFKDFPINFQINGGHVCEECIVGLLKTTLPAQQRQTWNTKEYRACCWCEQTLEVSELRHHAGEDNIVCWACHPLVCADIRCRGWTQTYIHDNRWLFCAGHNDLQYPNRRCPRCPVVPLC